jgi:DNA-binding MarR family transcriptional regulator
MIETNMSSLKTSRPHMPLLDAVRTLYGVIERFDLSVGAALGVDRSALRAINAMERGPVSPGLLGDVLGLSSGSVTALLNRLETASHIERVPSREDGRRRDVSLTTATRRRAQQHYERLGKSIGQSFGALSNKELLAAEAAILSLARCFEVATQSATNTPE